MQQILNKPMQDDSIAQFLSLHSLQWLNMREVKQFADGAIYWSFKPLGLQLCFVKQPKTNQHVLDSIFVYNKQQGKKSAASQQPSSNFEQYVEPASQQLLPHGVTMQMNNVDIVKKLGEPGKKGGGARTGTNIWISYENLGLQFDLVGNSWDDLKNPIAFITIFPPM